MWRSLVEIGFRDLLDIGLVAVALYAVIVWLNRARATLAVVGALILGSVYLAARELRLPLSAALFQSFFTVFVIILVVVLQNDLRRLFERTALWWVGRKAKVSGEERAADALCSAARELADQRRGALIVIPGRDPLDQFIHGGETLDGKLSHSLLVSLFDPGSTGHDGAVIVDRDRVSRFAVHLPLSTNFPELQRRGTRHGAALGLSELSDALCIVVSEERGEVILALDGRLHEIDEGQEPLQAQLVSFFRDRCLDPRAHRLSVLRRNGAAMTLAAMLSFGLWVVFVAGTQASQKTVRVKVLVDNIYPGYVVERIEPKEVAVTFTGLRRDLYLLDPTTVEVHLDAFPVGLGRRTFWVAEGDIRHPTELRVQAIVPSSVKLDVTQPKEQSPSR